MLAAEIDAIDFSTTRNKIGLISDFHARQGKHTSRFRSGARWWEKKKIEHAQFFYKFITRAAINTCSLISTCLLAQKEAIKL